MIESDYNIEFAHFYADQVIGKEQINSIEILNEFTHKLNCKNKTFVISILVDEFHTATYKLNKTRIINEFKKHGITLDFIGYESKLAALTEQIVRELPKSMLKHEHFSKPKKEVLILNANNKKVGLEEEFIENQLVF